MCVCVCHKMKSQYIITIWTHAKRVNPPIAASRRFSYAEYSVALGAHHASPLGYAGQTRGFAWSSQQIKATSRTTNKEVCVDCKQEHRHDLKYIYIYITCTNTPKAQIIQTRAMESLTHRPEKAASFGAQLLHVLLLPTGKTENICMSSGEIDSLQNQPGKIQQIFLSKWKKPGTLKENADTHTHT